MLGIGISYHHGRCQSRETFVEQQHNNTPSFQDLYRLFRRGLLLSIISALLAAGAVYVISQSREPRYQARATVMAAQVSPDLRAFGMSLVTASPLDANSYRVAATSSPVLAGALRELEGDTRQPTIQQLRNSVRVRTEIDRNSVLIHIDVTDPRPETAMQIANAVVNALLQWDTGRATQTLDTVVATLEEQIAALDVQLGDLVVATEDGEDQRLGLAALRAQQQTQLSSARALRNSAVGLLEVLEPATMPPSPISPRPLRDAALAFVLVFSLVYVVLLLRDALNTKLRDSDELAELSGLPVLAEFPKRMQKTYYLPREATSYLRTNVLSATSSAHPKVILVTSALAGEGKSSVALSLAASFAINGQHALLVDADLRKPVLGRVLNLNPVNHHPLQKHLENPHEHEGRFAPASVPVSATASLEVVPSFEPTPSPAELLSHGFHDCLKKWSEGYDVIIIDSPPVLPVADALTIAPLCTGTVLVTGLKRTDRRQVRAATETLQRLGVRILGVVAVRPTGAKGARDSHDYETKGTVANRRGPKSYEGTTRSSQP
jgi:non-specific protein-tyrosine kinase